MAINSLEWEDKNYPHCSCVLAHSPAFSTGALPCAAGRDGGCGEGSVEAPCQLWRRERAASQLGSFTRV